MTNLDFEMTVETIVEPIEESESIHPDNKELLIDYKGDPTLDGLSMATVQKRLSHLKVVAEHIGDRRFDELDKRRDEGFDQVDSGSRYRREHDRGLQVDHPIFLEVAQ